MDLQFFTRKEIWEEENVKIIRSLLVDILIVYVWMQNYTYLWTYTFLSCSKIAAVVPITVLYIGPFWLLDWHIEAINYFIQKRGIS
jgi:hypothetical protein